jgi:hypothetical protein
MRKWAVPLTVLGLGGVGALLMSDRGRRGVRWAIERLNEAPERLAQWNDNAQREMERIQGTLNRMSEMLADVRPIR